MAKQNRMVFYDYDDFPITLLSSSDRETAKRLFHKNGFIQEFVDMAGLKTDAAPYILTAGALMALSLAAGDVVVAKNPNNKRPVYLNLYILIVGMSTKMRKTTTLNMVEGIQPEWEHQGEGDPQYIVQWEKDASPEALVKNAALAGKAKRPICLIVDEAYGLFAGMKTKDWQQGYDKALLELFDHGSLTISRTSGNIEAPEGAFVTMLAASTEAKLIPALSIDDVNSGLIPRMLVFHGGHQPMGDFVSAREGLENHDEFVERSERLRARLADIAANRVSVATALGGEEFPTEVMDMADDALDYYDRILVHVDKEADKVPEDQNAIMRRAVGHVYKLSHLFALSRAGRRAKVEVEDVMRAALLVEYSLHDTIRKIVPRINETEIKRQIGMVEQSIPGSSGIARHVIARRLGLPNREFIELERTLISQRLIRAEDTGTEIRWSWIGSREEEI